SSGHRLEGDPGETAAGRVGGGIIARRMYGAWRAVAHHHHLFAIGGLLLGEKAGNLALARAWIPRDHGPVNLPRRARAEHRAEMLGGGSRLGHDEATGRVPVEPMHQAWRLALLVRQVLKKPVHMPRCAATALDRQAVRLVEDIEIV